MAHYLDLTPYEYDEDLNRKVETASPDERVNIEALIDAVNVGWLAARRGYPHGQTPPEFRAELFHRCRHPEWGHRGFHACTMGWCRFRRQYPIRERYRGEEVSLGAGVIIVRGRIRTYAAPNLIYHYVTMHNYRPPDGFIQAVLEARQPRMNDRANKRDV